MEDYKKKYEHALDNFKKIKAANKDNKELVDFIEYEYPELKESESEDEKIREVIINVFNISEPDETWGDTDITTKDIITWLERQGENSSYEKVQPVSEILGRVYEAEKQLEQSEQGEQKLEQEEDVELTDFESALFSAFSDAWQEYLSGEEVNVAKWTREHSAELLEVAREQKPAWSEEDEDIFNDIIVCLDGNFKSDKNMINWLKSLKERMKGE
jgi:hypothetical protein